MFVCVRVQLCVLKDIDLNIYIYIEREINIYTHIVLVSVSEIVCRA